MGTNPSWRPNERSRESPVFSGRLNAVSFITQFNDKKPRMRQIVDELQKIGPRLKGLQYIAQIGKFVAVVAVAVVIVIAVLTVAVVLSHKEPFTAEFIFKGIYITCFLALLAGVTAFVQQKEIEKQCEKKMDEFRMIVASLNSDLEDVKSACGECRRAKARAEALKFIRLEIKILEVFALTENLRTSVTVRSITEVANQYNKVFDEFENMKKRLEAPNDYSFREDNDTEMTLFDALKHFFLQLLTVNNRVSVNRSIPQD